jgi:hypothetical protein
LFDNPSDTRPAIWRSRSVRVVIELSVIVMPVLQIQLLSKAYIGARSSRETNGWCCCWIAPKLYDPEHSGSAALLSVTVDAELPR